MKWTLNELQKSSGPVDFDEDVVIEDEKLAVNSRINSVKDVRVSGRGQLAESGSTFIVRMGVTGTMCCPDAITGAEIEVPFTAESDEVYAFTPSREDGVRTAEEGVVDLLPAVVDAILLEVPMQVTVAEEGSYPEGEGWKVYSEAEYERLREQQIDPRLAVLKQYKDE